MTSPETSWRSALNPRSGQSGKHLADGLAGGPDAGRDADAVVGRARDRQARLGGDGRPDPGGAIEVADVVLRQAATPAGDTGLHGTAGDPGRLGSHAEDNRREPLRC